MRQYGLLSRQMMRFAGSSFSTEGDAAVMRIRAAVVCTGYAAARSIVHGMQASYWALRHALPRPGQR
jgi:hypothetical protein